MMLERRKKNSLRSDSKPRDLNLMDLDSDVLRLIFSNFNMVDMSRVAVVNHRCRELVEDMEEECSKVLRSTEEARIFVVDRRRAILERMGTHKLRRLPRMMDSPSSSFENLSVPKIGRHRIKSTGTTSTESSEVLQHQPSSQPQQTSDKKSGSSAPPLPFISDQYADNKQPNWAYKFDFNEWISTYDVNEVYFKNFCSFLEREKNDMEMNYKGRTPSPSEGGSTRSFEKLPSTQLVISESMHKQLYPKDIEGLKRISAGRVERLAGTLANVRNAHFVFKDFVCYTSRPPALMFWFISMMRLNYSRLTFDRVQACTPCEAHEVLGLGNVHRLTVIQPESKPAMIVRHQLLTSWLRLADKLRKKISIHLSGCHELTPKGLATFVNSWRARKEPAIFKQISIDGNSFKYNEFITELEYLQRDDEKAPPKSPFSSPSSTENSHAVVLEKTVEIYHSQDAKVSVRFKYCKPSRRMVLTCEVDHVTPILMPLSPVPTLSRLSSLTSLTRPHSAAALHDLRRIPSVRNAFTADNNKRISRPMSQNTMQIQNCRDGSSSSEDMSLVNRLFRFLATSN